MSLRSRSRCNSTTALAASTSTATTKCRWAKVSCHQHRGRTLSATRSEGFSSPNEERDVRGRRMRISTGSRRGTTIPYPIPRAMSSISGIWTVDRSGVRRPHQGTTVPIVCGMERVLPHLSMNGMAFVRCCTWACPTMPRQSCRCSQSPTGGTGRAGSRSRRSWSGRSARGGRTPNTRYAPGSFQSTTRSSRRITSTRSSPNGSPS